MGANGIVHCGEPISHNTIQAWIDEATMEAGIPRGAGDNFTTHTYRRGGAQWHWMFAPVGQRWTLTRVRWWGSWAENENHDTLIRYLLDELSTYENDHSDTLCPMQREADASLLDVLHSPTLPLHPGNSRTTYPCPSPSNPPVSQPRPAVPSSILPQPSALTQLGTGSHLLPEKGLVIPDIPTRCSDRSHTPRAASWRQIMKHWTDGDPECGLLVPLRDWPPKWICRKNKKFFAMKYHQCSVIALEFLDQFDGHEPAFLAAYPEATEGHTALLRAINHVKRARGDIIPCKCVLTMIGINDLWEACPHCFVHSPGVFQVLEPAAATVPLISLAIQGCYEGPAPHVPYVVGVYASAWFKQCQQVQLVFTFDGNQQLQIKRGHRVSTNNHWMVKPTQRLLNAFNMQWITAAGEAEAQLAQMNSAGVIDAIMMDDSDVFVFGAHTVLCNSTFSIDSMVKLYTASAIQEHMDCHLTGNRFLTLTICCGSDYDKKGLVGCGRETALGLARCVDAGVLRTAMCGNSLDGPLQ
ncbi:hypothetical protein DFH29DRAFT_997043 [Suillus ampliporus]|nr:hypothetical protein DFH29DRAFT_997043 [Suillus ampliporus]